jgi:hypothetical protein
VVPADDRNIPSRYPFNSTINRSFSSPSPTHCHGLDDLVVRFHRRSVFLHRLSPSLSSLGRVLALSRHARRPNRPIRRRHELVVLVRYQRSRWLWCGHHEQRGPFTTHASTAHQATGRKASHRDYQGAGRDHGQVGEDASPRKGEAEEEEGTGSSVGHAESVDLHVCRRSKVGRRACEYPSERFPWFAHTSLALISS